MSPHLLPFLPVEADMLSSFRYDLRIELAEVFDQAADHVLPQRLGRFQQIWLDVRRHVLLQYLLAEILISGGSLSQDRPFGRGSQ